MNEARIEGFELEDRCHIQHGSVDAWLMGDEPSLGDVRKVAKLLGRSMQFFLLPEPPQSSPSTAQFRSSLHTDTSRPEREEVGLRSARRAQKLAIWAGELQHPNLISASNNETPSSYAQRLKDHIRWTNSDQQGATSKSAVFRNLRAKLESLGLIVLMQPAGDDGYRGFSLEGAPPVVFINKDYRGAALRTFTLLHEVAHLGAGTGGVSCYYEDSSAERWCNQVATEFLLPQLPFVAYVRGKGVTRVTEQELDIVRLASNYFKASWLAIAIRLAEVGMASNALPDYVRANYDLERDPSTPITGVDRSTPIIRREEFGQTYLGVLRQAVQSDKLSEVEAGKLVRADASQLTAIWALTAEAG